MRRYPPLLAVVIALLLAVLALPSALNLPQANPGQTLEYAPVPGNGQAPPGGNIAGLGLGQSGTVGSGGEGTNPATPPALDLPNTTPPASLKRCVGNPPRQTEDRLSPPCVAFFNGNNGGATYGGVSGSDINIMFYFDGGHVTANGNEGGVEQQPTSQYFDLAQPQQPGEYSWITILRNWMHYFNDRYQTYNRRLHFYVYFGNKTATTDQRRADAADNFATHHPFAVLPYATFGGLNGDYLDAMAQRGVMGFGSVDLRTDSIFQRYPGLQWGYTPSTDSLATSYASYVCNKIKPNTVSFSGNGDSGSTRTYGFLSTTDPRHPELQEMASQIQRQLHACGISFISHTFPVAQYTQTTSTPSDYATSNMADFAAKHVTTILWGGGYEPNQSKAAANLNYYPEWVLAGGDGLTEGQIDGTYQDQNEWRHAVVVSPNPRLGVQNLPVEQSCFDAYSSANPNFNRDTSELIYACTWYDDIRQLVTGIQVAGPRLTPATVEQGFRAIPPTPSPDALTPSCYYIPGNYTCVKDAVSEWWDYAATGGGTGTAGCWRMIEDGRRYLPGRWDAVDPGQQRTATVCNQNPGTTVIQSPGG